MQRRMRLLLAVVLVLSTLPSPASAQRLRIVVGGANFRPFPVAAPELSLAKDASSGLKHTAGELTSLLQTDVDLARPLELVPPTTYLAPAHEAWTKPEFANWANVGASGLVRGLVEPTATGVKVSMRFYDVVAQREVLSKSYEESTQTAGRAIHQFVDLIIETLTGEPGIFSTKIAFIKRTARGKALYTTDVDGRNPKRLTDDNVLSLLPAWDASGRFLLFTSFLQDNPDLYRLDRSNHKLECISSKRGLNTGAAVSPDGKHIALTLSTDGNTEIYVMDWNGNNLTRLTDSWGQDVSPSWSPDNKRIAFVSSRAGNPHLYIMDANGANVRRLTFQGNYNQEPNWSPRKDGQIAFTARDERLKFDIFLVHPETGEITRLTQDQGNNESPSFSPDGHHIAFTSSRPPHNGSKKIYVMDADGTNQRRITLDGGEYETPAWGPRLGYK